MERLLITGGSGLLGGELVRQAVERWEILYTWFNHPVRIPGSKWTKLDILDRRQVLQVFQYFRPHAVIHTAYSQVNLRTISQGTANVAESAAIVGAKLLHLSTDAVFDGQRGGYSEEDIAAPVHNYGKTKLEAERAVERANLPSFVTIRTSLLLSLNPMDKRTLFLKEQLEMNKKLIYFTDEYRCPISIADLSAAILEILHLGFQGVIHVAGPERVNRYELAKKLACYLGLNPQNIIPGLSSESGIVRPLDCSLDTSLSQRLLKVKISSATEILSSDLGIK